MKLGGGAPARRPARRRTLQVEQHAIERLALALVVRHGERHRAPEPRPVRDPVKPGLGLRPRPHIARNGRFPAGQQHGLWHHAREALACDHLRLQ
jgi:hypothetical protein